MEEARTSPGLGPGESKSLQVRMLESGTSTCQVIWEDTVLVSLLVLGQKKYKIKIKRWENEQVKVGFQERFILIPGFGVLSLWLIWVYYLGKAEGHGETHGWIKLLTAWHKGSKEKGDGNKLVPSWALPQLFPSFNQDHLLGASFHWPSS